jgi:hypothetical protein
VIIAVWWPQLPSFSKKWLGKEILCWLLGSHALSQLHEIQKKRKGSFTSVLWSLCNLLSSRNNGVRSFKVSQCGTKSCLSCHPTSTENCSSETVCMELTFLRGTCFLFP